MKITSLMDIRQVARALGGDIYNGNSVLVPGPGHSAKDRSLSVTLDASAPCRFVVYSHAGDDFPECRDSVLQRLGIKPEFAQRRADLPARNISHDPSPPA